MSHVARLRAAEPKDRVAAIADLERHGAPSPEEAEALIGCLGDARKLVQRRAAEACAALIANDEIGSRLRAALQASSERVRWGAAYALALAGEVSPPSLDVIVEVLGCDDGDLRWAALDLLKRQVPGGSDPIVERLRRLAADGNPQQRKMALYGLRDLNIADPAVAVAAEGALSAPQADVRLAAIATLGKLAIDRGRAAKTLLALLDDRDPPIQRAAAAALGSLGIASAEVIDVLERSAGGTDVGLRRAAERSLRILRPTKPG